MTTPLTQGLHHLGFTVSDLTAARDFFTKALHFELLGENDDYPAAFVTDNTTVITLWAADKDAKPFDRRQHAGLHHAAFLVDTIATLQDIFDRLSAWPGVEVECEISPPESGSSARHFLILMPGGPRIEFWVSQTI